MEITSKEKKSFLEYKEKFKNNFDKEGNLKERYLVNIIDKLISNEEEISENYLKSMIIILSWNDLQKIIFNLKGR